MGGYGPPGSYAYELYCIIIRYDAVYVCMHLSYTVNTNTHMIAMCNMHSSVDINPMVSDISSCVWVVSTHLMCSTLSVSKQNTTQILTDLKF